MVIGGGLLGLEAAAGMAARGVDVTVVHIMGHLMERQLDEAAGYLLKKSLKAKGIKSPPAGEFKGDHRRGWPCKGLACWMTGPSCLAICLVMAVGIRPSVALGQYTGLAVGKGIHVDDQMITSDEDVLAVGECVEHDGAIFGLVAPLYEQAKVAASTLLGEEAAFVQKIPIDKAEGHGL